MHYLGVNNINYLAVLASAVIQWLLGWLWYSLLFAKPWKAAVGHKGGEDAKSGTALAMASSFIASFILCFVLAHTVSWVSGITFSEGAFVGLVCWLGFMALPMSAQHIYERRPFNLFAINVSYWLVCMVISGGVLAVWR